MPMERQAASGFSNVDQNSNPQFFVQYLGTASALETFKEYKRATYAQLGASAGSRILDVGCGLGDDVQAISQLVGPSGWVVGVDSSEIMVAEATKRAAGLNVPVEFRVGNALHLDFEHDVFDGCRADRILQHLEDPETALSEMVRVTRPGGRVVAIEPDWETLVVDHPNRPLTRAIVHAYCDDIASGWVGRALFGLCVKSGLQNVGVITRTLVVTDYALAIRFVTFDKTIERLQARGAISAEDGANWLADLGRRSDDGTYFSATTLFGVSGTKPA
jgi:ubiquinone/menaquinone biosynthesis C-methylase UbiE